MALCHRCEHCLPDSEATASVGQWSPEEEREYAVGRCDQCGAALVPSDLLDAMLAKLAQLSRFGLGADDRPLLVHSEGDDR